MVSCSTIDEKRPFVFLCWTFLQIVGTEISDRIPSLALLDLPSSHVRIDEQIRFCCDESCACADNDQKPLVPVFGLFARPGKLHRIKKILNFKRIHSTKYRIVAQY